MQGGQKRKKEGKPQGQSINCAKNSHPPHTFTADSLVYLLAMCISMAPPIVSSFNKPGKTEAAGR